ncbi:winged helix family transcriptional regulator [Ornithinimicrobium pratense]|uniref:OmpR/PhoB-type domain-containing protein n=1 Tax=Ornithinimicrobium pratense TaxID=2593973 RepID=A0A5J6V2U8_9MICO|nr:winged helix family transcriptional regulator [Ornithinimicrobium pratense]QFG67606.1 hypothetical protein FY030_01665 [Ornithinimicrobium pratense]
MGARTYEAQRPRDTLLELTRTATEPSLPHSSGLPTGSRSPAPSLVVIIATSRAEQQRLLAALPEDVAVLVTTTAEQAEELLQTLPASPCPEPGLTVRTAERTVCWGGERSVRLTPLEFALLQTLSLDQARVWSFAELSRRVWATGLVGDGAQVRAVVKRLRRKLAEAQAPVLVETVRGAGFRLVAQPQPPNGA